MKSEKLEKFSNPVKHRDLRDIYLQSFGSHVPLIAPVCRQQGKRANLRTAVTRKQNTPNFLKNKYFSPHDAHMYYV